MNQVTEATKNNNSFSEDSSDEESLDFFHINDSKKLQEKKDLLNNKRKYSEDSNGKEKEKEKEKSSSSDNSDSIEHEETKEKKKNKKEKYYNFKSVKSKQVCQFYINGACKKGDKCPYSHDAEQIHKKELCKFYLSGKCAKGEKCLYSHDLSEIPCKYYHGLGFCENFQNCPFSHERLDEEGIKEFIVSNEDFLKDTKNKYGRTNLDEFYNAYLKEKEGGNDQYIMMPEFIKQEDKDKEKENNEINNKIPLGFVVMCNNNKIVHELKNFYNNQNMNLNINNMNMLNNLKNINRSNSFNNNNNDNIDQVSKIINDIKNSKKEKLNIMNDKNKDNKETLINKNNNISNITNNGNLNLKSEFNFFKENKDNLHKIETQKVINKENNKSNNVNMEGKNDKPKGEKKLINPIEINPFLNPMLIGSDTINNLF